MFNFKNYMPQQSGLRNFVPNNPQKSKNVNCNSCGLKGLRTYFICEECGLASCYNCMIRFNTGRRICNGCYDKINQFNNQKTAAKVDNLFAEIFSDTTYVSIKTAADEGLIDEFAGAILALLNDDNNLKIENGKLSQETINNINNTVVNEIKSSV